MHIEFVLPLLFAELLGGSPPQHLHGFAGDPVVLVEKPAQILNPLAGEHQALLQQPTHRALLGQGHQLIAAAQAAKQQHLHLQGGAPDIHRAVNHEGAVGHKQHRCAFKRGVQHQVEQQLHAPLHVLVGAEAVVVAALHVQPAEHRPPEGCIHRCDPADGALAVIGDQGAVLLHKAGGEDSPGLVSAALQFQADREEVAHDPVAPLQQQVEHHGHVVPHKHLAVIDGSAFAWMLQGRHRTHELSPHPHQAALEMGIGDGHHGLFIGAAQAAQLLLAERRFHGNP